MVPPHDQFSGGHERKQTYKRASGGLHFRSSAAGVGTCGHDGRWIKPQLQQWRANKIAGSGRQARCHKSGLLAAAVDQLPCMDPGTGLLPTRQVNSERVITTEEGRPLNLWAQDEFTLATRIQPYMVAPFVAGNGQDFRRDPHRVRGSGRTGGIPHKYHAAVHARSLLSAYLPQLKQLQDCVLLPPMPVPAPPVTTTARDDGGGGRRGRIRSEHAGRTAGVLAAAREGSSVSEVTDDTEQQQPSPKTQRVGAANKAPQ